jgi:hypothetical protein
MPIIAKNAGKKRELAPQGNHVAICYKMIELGTITDTFQGEDVTRHRVLLYWELSNELKDFDGSGKESPISVSKEFTLSMNEKSTLRKMLESWRGKAFTKDEANAFDITKLMGIPCMVNVIHVTSGTGNQYENVSSITPLPKGMEKPTAVNKTIEFSIDGFDQALFDSFPDFIKEKINSSAEMQAKPQAVPVEVEEEEELPF